MEIRVVIFDFDGTIADTRKAIITAKQQTMQNNGLVVMDEEACASTIGLTARDGFIKLYPGLQDEQLDVLVTEYRRRFEEQKTITPPERFDGVDRVLAELEKRNIKRTIATSRNKKSLHEFLSQWGMEDSFQYILCGEDTKRLKPNPDPVLKTMEALSVLPQQTLVVGDMPMDIEMGKRAGAYTCGVTYGNASAQTLLSAGADYVVDAMEEILDLI